MPLNDSEKGSSFFKVFEELQTFFLFGIFMLILFHALYIAREIIVPFVIALLFNFLLTPSVKLLRRFHIPAQIGSALVILLLLFIIGLSCYGLAHPATTWLNKGPEAIESVNQKLTTLANAVPTSIKNVSEISKQIPLLSGKQSENNQNNMAPYKVSFVAGTVAVTSKFLVEFTVTIILLYFLLCYDHYFLRIFVQWVSTLGLKKDVVDISHQIQNLIFKYLFARTAINVGLAIVVSILMFILDMPDPILWGVMLGLLDYIPFLGAFIGVVVIAIVALFSFASVAYAFLVTCLVIFIFFIEANIVTPIVFGRTLTINPIIVFLGLIFFSWIWGIAGTFVAVPMMVSIKIIVETL